MPARVRCLGFTQPWLHLLCLAPQLCWRWGTSPQKASSSRASLPRAESTAEAVRGPGPFILPNVVEVVCCCPRLSELEPLGPGQGCPPYRPAHARQPLFSTAIESGWMRTVLTRCLRRCLLLRMDVAM
jgi:hypothetical protein